MKKKLLIVFIMGCFLLTSLFSGCGSKTTGTGGNKTLIYSQGADPRGLDPAYVDDGESAKVIVNIFEGLVKYKNNSTEIEPSLATDWKISPDGKEYTFNLRKNVKFQDGTPFNADAVVFSVERQLPPKVTDDMPYASFTFGEVEKIEKVNDYCVKFTLKQPYTPFLANLAMCLAAPIVSPTAVQKYGDKFIENPVGTGPFKFVKWDKGQSLTIEKNNEYWGDKAKLDKVIFKFTKENSVRASEIMAGNVDIIDGVDPNDVKKIEEKGVNVLKNNGMNINYLAFNCSRAPFNNAKLRQAVAYAVNTDELVKYLYQGYAQTANSPLPSFIPGYDKDVKQIEFNPEKTKTLLKEAGVNNLEVKIITYSNPRPYNPVNGQKLAEAIQNALTKVGIKSTIVAYPWKEYKTKVQQGEGDIFFSGWIGDNGDADNFLSLFDSKEIKTGMNGAKYANTKVDELLAEARKTPNGSERDNIYKEIQKILAVDAPWIPISHATEMAAYSSKVKNFTVHPTGTVFFQYVDKE